MQTIQQLEARALRRADTVDELEHLLYAAKGKRRTEDLRGNGAGLWAALKRMFLPNRLAAKAAKLECDVTRARAALKIAVEELHQAHCAHLRTAPWSGTLVAPSEAELRGANEEYHPWNRVQMSGKGALSALYKIDASGDSDSVALVVLALLLATGGNRFTSSGLAERIKAMHQSGDAILGFVNATRALARAHPETGADRESESLTAIAKKLSSVRTRIGAMAISGQIDGVKRTIAAIVMSAEQASGSERGQIGVAQGRLQEVNHQIALAAWSKIPARLRPSGR